MTFILKVINSTVTETYRSLHEYLNIYQHDVREKEMAEHFYFK